MNGSTHIPTIQPNIEWYIPKNYYGTIDAMNWELAEGGTYYLHLYRGGEQSDLVLKKNELQSYILQGWEQRFQEKLNGVVDDK
jgi:hypothetical protein